MLGCARRQVNEQNKIVAQVLVNAVIGKVDFQKNQMSGKATYQDLAPPRPASTLCVELHGRILTSKLSMATDPVTILKDIGKQYGRRVSRANHLDANVCTSPIDHERPWEILALPGDIFRHKLNITLGDHKITLHANGSFIAATVSGNLEVEVCSINSLLKNPVFLVLGSEFQVITAL
jgi:hypothetical protein